MITQRLGWRWIFWLLALLSGAQLLAMALFFPETARSVVGNGSVSDGGRKGTLVLYVRKRASSSPDTSQPPLNRSHYWPNPLASLRVILDKNSALVMLSSGLFYTVFSCLAASLSTLWINIYHLNYLEAGLIYLPAGVGGILAAYKTGKSQAMRTIGEQV